MTYYLMTTEDLIDTIGATVGDQEWYISPGGWIRNSDGQCPVCALVDALSDGDVLYLDHAKLAWSNYFSSVYVDEYLAINDVMGAADYSSLSPNRLRLLSALGLSDAS